MKIDIIVNQTHKWGPEDLEGGKINGSEEMVVNLARALRRIGHYVDVYCTLRGKDREFGGVWWHDHGTLATQGTWGDHLICFKAEGALLSPGYKQRFLWTADPVSLTPMQRDMCDWMFAISPWHEKELRSLNFGYSRIGAIEPALDPIIPSKHVDRTQNQCLYVSSHDRGLYDLLAMWPDIKEEVPDAQLVVTYDQPENEPELDGVHFIGRVSEQSMVDLYASSDVLLYPCTGGERYCIAALKAQYYGCVPCVIPTMALRDTVMFGVRCTRDDYKKKAIKLLKSTRSKATHRRRCLSHLEYSTWEAVALQWEAVLSGEATPRSAGI